MTVTVVQRRGALFGLFFVPGIAISSWVTRTPAIRDLLDASTGEMGFVLFGLSVGSMVGIVGSGALVARLGARPVILAGTAAVVASLPVIGFSAAAGVAPLVAVGLFLFGVGGGGGEVAMNVEGADVEQRLGRPVLPAMHGFFSLGTVVGASAGILLTAIGFPVVMHLVSVSVVALLVLIGAMRFVPAGVGRVLPGERGQGTEVAGGRFALLRDGRLLLIGAIVLAMALAEGTANDWLPLVMVDGHGFDATLGSTIYAVFAASMTVGRFIGGRFIDRFGRATVLCISAIAGATGLAVVIFVDNQIAAGAAVVLWGLGASLGFPVALSAAGASGSNAAARVSLVATIGYIAFLVGPPLLGFLGDHYTLRIALIVPMTFVAAAIFLAPRITTHRTAENAPETATR